MIRDEVRRLLARHQEALNRHDVSALTGLYAEDAVVDSPMFDTVRGRAAIRRSFEQLFAMFPDYVSRVGDAPFLADGDRAAAFSTITGTHKVALFGLPPTGRQIEYQAVRLFTVRNGMFVYEQRIYDFRGVLERLEKTRLEREMSLASVVQHALCRTQHAGPYFDAVGASLPCRAIGGDFLEFLDLPGGKVSLVVGDVAGKGAAAALVAAMLQGMLSIVATAESSPSATLSRLNGALLARRIEPRYATLTYGILAPDGRFTYANAGHHPPLLLTADGMTTLTEGGRILGVFGDAVFPEASVQLAPGDTVVAFSDGVTEAVAPDGSDFGMERLCDVAAAHRTDAPDRLVAHLLAEVQRFSDSAPSHDDVTIAAIKYR